VSSSVRPFLACLAFALLVTLGCQATSFFSTEEPETPAPPTIALQTTGAPGVLAQPQDATPLVEATPAAPLEPHTFVEAIAGEIDSFNPVLATSDAAATVLPLILPRLVGQDAQSGAVIASELASNWILSADGRTVTFTLRSDVTWSDGQPVTGRDVGFTLAALAHPQVNSPLVGLTDVIERVQLIGDHTVTLGLSAPDCAVLDGLRLPILPSHLFAADFSDLRTNPFNEAPTVSAGPFLFAGRQPGQRIELMANPTFWRGAPAIERYVLRIVPSAAERARLVAEGEVDLAEVDWDAAQLLQGSAGLYLVETLADGYSFLALNLADPLTPASGLDANGVVQPQLPHPVFGDPEVRRAVASGVDFHGIIRSVYGDSAMRSASFVPPATTWAALTDGAAPPYDPTDAQRRLEAAGWSDASGDGVRERGDALLQATLIVNDDNPQRVEMARQVSEQLRRIGFDIRMEALSFTRTAEIALGQRFDIVILGWEHLGAEPARLAFWGSRNDLPGVGLNVTSYQNAAVDILLDEARTLPGCDLAGRSERYRQAQRIIQQEAAFIPLVAQQQHWALSRRWHGMALTPWLRHGQVERWAPAPTSQD
jgi:peptide/nickel transport system substrate-binding protein